jgi:hypothetical protein
MKNAADFRPRQIAFREGYQHANEGGRIMDNPYDNGELMPSRESDAWEAGFNLAMEDA